VLGQVGVSFLGIRSLTGSGKAPRPWPGFLGSGLFSRHSNCGDADHFKRRSLAAGSPNRRPRDDDDGSVQPVATLLNISVVGGRNVGSESLATSDQLL